MSMKRTRVYYRNSFMHIGHVNTLYYNNNVAEEHNGECFAIIDDRQDPDRIESIQEDFDYLELKHIKVISVHKYRKAIMDYTEDLIKKGDIYLHYCSSIETNTNRIIQHLKSPKMHFQLKLRCGSKPNTYKDPSVGYTKGYNYPEELTVMLIFDYIIKVLDYLLDVTDIISTTTSTSSEEEVSDVRDQNISNFFDNISNHKITYHRLNTYYIHGFKYSKKNWPQMNERDPYLLTIKGLKARHIPPVIIYAFYLHAAQMGTIRISHLGTLTQSYMYRNADRALGVVKPLEVEIANWEHQRTEYICKQVNPIRDSKMSLCSLSKTFYIDQSDYGIDAHKWTKGRVCRIKYGPIVKCIDVVLGDKFPKKLIVEILDGWNNDRKVNSVQWVSSEWNQSPVKVLYYLYNWFYTGQNTIMDPRISEGYIERSAFNDLSKVYQLERNGYYVYDKYLSRINAMPTFICICKIKN